MNKKQILKKVIQHYLTNPRSVLYRHPDGTRSASPIIHYTGEDVGTPQCYYNNGWGGHCAVGLFLKEDLKKEGEWLDGNGESIDELVQVHCGLECDPDDMPSDCVDPLLEEEAQGHERAFWGELQYLHDHHHHWKGADGGPAGELTRDGRDAVEQVTRNWDIPLTNEDIDQMYMEAAHE